MFSRRELSLLRAMYFHATVTAAAQAAHISQPAASALLQDLEARLGFALFARVNRRLQLTSQGRALMPEVLQAMSALDAVDRLAGDIRQSATARLNVGAVAVTAAMLLPEALVSVKEAHPNIAITVRAGTALDIMDMVADHRVDLGVVVTTSSRNDDRFALECLARLSLHAVFRPDHPSLRLPRPMTLKDVADLGLIVLAANLPAGLATQQALEAAGLKDRPVIEVSQSFTACEFVQAGLGVAVVETLGAGYARQRALVTRHLLDLDDTELALVLPHDRPLVGASQLLRESLLAAVERLKMLS